MKKTAILSADGRYRYRLTRGEGRLMPVVMLNPSTADADVDDPTIRRLLGFAQGVRIESRSVSRIERFDGIDVVNLYAFRSPYPKELQDRTWREAHGPDNPHVLDQFVQQYRDGIICAWGGNATGEAERAFSNIVDRYVPADVLLSCFGLTKGGKPKHPLYLPKTTKLAPYWRMQP